MKKVYVLAKDKEILGFLKGFFKSYETYEPRYLPDMKSLGKIIKDCDVLILDAPCCLDNINQKTILDCPIVAIIPQAGTAEGLRCVVKHNIEGYLLAPHN